MSILLSYAIASEIRIRHTYEKSKSNFTQLINRYAPLAYSKSLEQLYRVRRPLVKAIEWLDTVLPTENPACDRSILCMHEGRHLKGCHAYTVPFKKYARGISRG